MVEGESPRSFFDAARCSPASLILRSPRSRAACGDDDSDGMAVSDDERMQVQPRTNGMYGLCIAPPEGRVKTEADQTELCGVKNVPG